MNRKEKIRGMLPVLQQRQRDVDEVVKDRIGDRKTSCDSCTSPGCCYQKSLIQLAEAVLVAQYLKKEKRDTPELRKKLRETGERIEAVTREEWFAKGEPCVFLTEDKRCSIYEVRPISCRAYYVVSPVENCQPPKSQGITQIDFRSLLLEELRHYEAMQVFWGLHESPEKIYMRPIPMAVFIALRFLDEPTIEVVDRIKWPSAEQNT